MSLNSAHSTEHGALAASLHCPQFPAWSPVMQVDYKFAVHAKRLLGDSSAHLHPGASLDEVWRGVRDYAAVQLNVPPADVVCDYVYLKSKQREIDYCPTAASSQEADMTGVPGKNSFLKEPST